MHTNIFKTDWLASKPVFYNEKTYAISHNINDVIDYVNLELHPEGLNNYLEFGYSVLGQTPLKHVKFLKHSSSIIVDSTGNLKIEKDEDSPKYWYGRITNEDEVLGLIEASINNWESKVDGEIVIPTSGGYDSRLLNYFIKDKERIRTFTYGISSKQDKSYEAVYAKKLSEILNIRWKLIELGDFHNFFTEWDKLFGPSVHAHGMYHYEFYSKIKKSLNKTCPLLSGIIGDAWAGSIKTYSLSGPMDLINLGYNHGIKADISHSKLIVRSDLKEEFWELNRKALNDPFWQVIWMMRFKIILLTYIIKVPNILGFKSWSPFLEKDIALSMLQLPESRRKERIWQKEYFEKRGLDIENMNLKVDYRNTLNHQAMERVRLLPLDMHILSEVIDENYIDWINRLVCKKTIYYQSLYKLLYTPKVGGLLHRLRFRDKILEAYSAYLVLKPIENILNKRNIAQHSQIKN